MSNRAKGWIIGTLSLVLLMIDQIVKIAVKLNMTIGEGFSMFGNSSWAKILFIEKNGMAFGMQFGGIAGKLALSIFRIILIALLIWYIGKLIKKYNAPWGALIGVTLILVGAIGDIVDSMFYGLIFTESTNMSVASLVPFGEGYAPFLCGKVVDMFYFPLIQTTLPDWLPIWGGRYFEFFRPIFNFADSCITCGVIYLLLFQKKFFAQIYKTTKSAK